MDDAPKRKKLKTVNAATSLAELLEHDDAAFIACAYLTLLMRPPDPLGYSYYRVQLGIYSDKLSIIYSLYYSEESQRLTKTVRGLRAAMVLERLKLILGLKRLKAEINGKNSASVCTAISSSGDSSALKFDERWYITQYPDVLLSGIDPEEHYQSFGKFNGRYCCREQLVCSFADIERYKRANADVIPEASDPLEFFDNCGRYEQKISRLAGIKIPLFLFDSNWYRKNNPHLNFTEKSPLMVYLDKGPVDGRSTTSVKPLSQVEPEPETFSEPLIGLEVTVLAFYCADFLHGYKLDANVPNAETPWNRIAQAQRSFKEHDQPRREFTSPRSNCTDASVLADLSKMAVNHGIAGFCIDFNIGISDASVDTPLMTLLRHSEIALQFCCRWVVDYKSHNFEEFVFLQLVRAFSDPRYVHVDRKPMLVFGPAEDISQAIQTIKRFRARYKTQCGSEIHVCYFGSVANENVEKLGIDAFIQYLPNHECEQEITSALPIVDSAFRGRVFNYLPLIRRPDKNRCTNRLLYRCVIPGWDSTPNRGYEADCYYGATPQLFAEWLDEAVLETMATKPINNRLIFVRSWNDWGNGAYLEPDGLRGYSVLNHTRDALAKYSKQLDVEHELKQVSVRNKNLAVVTHLYHADLFQELARHLDLLEDRADLYFSVRQGAFSIVNSLIKRRFPHAVVVSYPNRGRDVLPFLRIFSCIERFGYEAICKVHSKKSLHRSDGNEWRNELFDQLLGNSEAIAGCLNSLRVGAGIVAPAGHLIDGYRYVGANSEKLGVLAMKMGCPHRWLKEFRFPASTMFWFRPEALGPLMRLGLQPLDFELESRQLDGTTAHAVERLFALSALKGGFKVVESGSVCSPSAEGYRFSGITS